MKKITSKLSKTPYLVILTVLIAITVTSAYALTITLGGDVIITGSTDLDGALLDSSDDAGTSGQLLSSTGTGVDWVTLSGSGVLTVVERVSSPVNVAPDSFGETEVQCQSGEIVTGGGFHIGGGNGFPLVTFNDIEEPNGWEAGVFNLDPCLAAGNPSCSATITITATVMCTKLT